MEHSLLGSAKRGLGALSLLLFCGYGCQSASPDEAPGADTADVEHVGTAIAAINSQFNDPWSYDENSGLPLEPRAANMTLADLAHRLGDQSEIVASLRKVHPDTAKVRFLESYSREYPTFIKGNQVLMPKADGVLLQQSPVVTVGSVNPAVHCNSSHQCNELYTTVSSVSDKPAETQSADIVVLLAWNVEVAGPVFTEGRSLFIVADQFRGNGHRIQTQPRDFRPPPNPPTDNKAPNGRGDHHGGAFLLYTNVLDKLNVLASGMNGEAGTNGADHIGGEITSTELKKNAAGQLFLQCNGTPPTTDAQDGGNGGNGGHAGPIRVRYTTLVGSGTPRQASKTTPVSDWQCFSDPALGCGSPRCTDNPSVAICDVLTEADNAQCRDGIDNDGDGLTDCADPNCAGNPFVTICPQSATTTARIAESSPEACSDGTDNDNDGYTDCADYDCKPLGQCGGSLGAPPASCIAADGTLDCASAACAIDPACGGTGSSLLPRTTGYEESSNATCSNGLDDDGDGMVDCGDPECRYNSLVTVCTRENSIEACSDGKSNDGDSFADCNDFDCSKNPYVKICSGAQYYPFLAESTNATCSDGVDNDGDKYKDCWDFQCLNNPLVTVCGNLENTMAECTDGIDNDGDGYTDCSDDNCWYNPFFGDYACRQQVQTGHTQVAPPPSFNGNYLAASISLTSIPGTKGDAGLKGAALSATRVVSTPVPCDPSQDPGCSPYSTTTYTCTLGRIPAYGAGGTDGTATAPDMRFVTRRSTDTLRTQLSPNQWIVDAALGNTHFKNGDLKRAGFLYMHTLMRLQGVLSTANIASCATLPAAATSAQKLIAQNACPTLDRVQLRLTHLAAGLDFYGQSREPRINPRDRYQRLRQDFDARFSLLETNVNRYISLSNSLDLAQWFSVEGQKLQNEIDDAALDVAAADTRVNAARAAVDGLQQSVARRESDYKKTVEQLQTHNPADQINFGTFLLGLGQAALSSFGSEFLKGAGGAVLDIVGTQFGKWFGEESGKETAKAEDKEKAKTFVGSLKDITGDAAGSALKDAWEKNNPDLLKIVQGIELFPKARSTIGPVVESTVASDSQRRTINEYLDLLADLEKAKLELTAAQLDAQALRSHKANTERLRQQVTDYLGNNAALSALDRLLLIKQTYATTMMLLDDLNRRYRKVVRQAQYEKLPFASDTGENLLPASIVQEHAYTMVDYQQMKLNLLNLDANLNTYTSGQRTVYRRVTGDPFTAASADDVELLHTVGLDYLTSPSLFHLNITYDGLPPNQRNQHVRDVRVNFLGAGGGSFRPTAYLMRNTLDAFAVGRNPVSGKPWIVDFELADKDRAPNGAVRSPLHYQSLQACSAPPPACDLTLDTCRTLFQDAPTADQCSLSGAAQDSPDTVTFYDRSLAGDWMVVIPASDYATISTTLGGIQGVELVFDTVALDL
jgi:hypothetical protein